MNEERSVSQQLQEHLRRHARTGVRWVYPGSAPLPPAAAPRSASPSASAPVSAATADPRVRLMFVGVELDEKGGQLLTKIIEAIGLTRDDVFVATIAVNDDDLASARQDLEERIDAVAPVILVGLGGTATRVLFGRPVPRGRWTDHRGIAFMPTIHPSDLLRDASDKRLVWEDMQAVAERYNEDLPPGAKPAKAKSK